MSKLDKMLHSDQLLEKSAYDSLSKRRLDQFIGIQAGWFASLVIGLQERPGDLKREEYDLVCFLSASYQHAIDCWTDAQYEEMKEEIRSMCSERFKPCAPIPDRPCMVRAGRDAFEELRKRYEAEREAEREAEEKREARKKLEAEDNCQASEEHGVREMHGAGEPRQVPEKNEGVKKRYGFGMLRWGGKRMKDQKEARNGA